MYYLSQLALNNPPDTMVSSFATSWTGFYRSAFDHQWEAYRSNLLTMVLAALAWKIVMHTLSMPVTKHIWIFGLALLTYTFRVDIMLYGSILLLWYLFTAQLYHHKYFVPMCWIIMLLTLYTNEQMNHFRVVSSWMDQYAPVWFLS